MTATVKFLKCIKWSMSQTSSKFKTWQNYSVHNWYSNWSHLVLFGLAIRQRSLLWIQFILKTSLEIPKQEERKFWSDCSLDRRKRSHIAGWSKHGFRGLIRTKRRKVKLDNFSGVFWHYNGEEWTKKMKGSTQILHPQCRPSPEVAVLMTGGCLYEQLYQKFVQYRIWRNKKIVLGFLPYSELFKFFLLNYYFHVLLPTWAFKLK